MKNQIKIESPIKPFKKQIEVSSDKSLSIRCILLSSIALGRSKIFNLLDSEDVNNTLKVIKKIGVNYIKKKNFIEVHGVGINGFKIKDNTIIDAGNSGTLARLIMGLCSASEKKFKIIGDNSLSKRDFSRVITPLNLFGVQIVSNKNLLPIEMRGSNLLRPIMYEEKKGSAQIKTCIIFSAINTHGVTRIKALHSRNHTELLLKYLNYPMKIKKQKKYDLIELKGLNQFKSFNYKIPGDISSASFFITLTLLSKDSELLIKNINLNPSRIGILKILKKMNAKIKLLNVKNYKGEAIGDIKIKSTKKLKSINCPKSLNSATIDEFLLIFLIAAKSKGISIFKDLGELNKKESPRLDVAIKFLKMIGIKTKRVKNNVKIYGNPELKLDGKYHVKNFLKDHRVFMMSTIAALTLNGHWTIEDKDSINTSFPKFLRMIKNFGAKIN
ncbi:3-phosphoshikimate 1-carboxyvinyltransferase [Candidatus Pelagibacter sp.]|nr:3-phosphoshikimate 1-carboxyvinyltransferase [Candidatus Pelagibacter sp.]